MAKKKNSKESSEESREEKKPKQKNTTTQLTTVITPSSQLPNTTIPSVIRTTINEITETSTFPSRIDLPKTPGSTAPVVVSSSATTIPPQT